MIQRSDRDHNVILFPKTIQYYESRLTRFLQEERYGDAANLLSFLLKSGNAEERRRTEWEELLRWLRASFPDKVALLDETADWDAEPPEETEQELFRKHVRSKALADAGYVEKLLDTLLRDNSAGEQLSVLERLSCLDDDRIVTALRGWLEESRLHPLVQFKALQVLKMKGATGQLQLRKLGESFCLDIERTPLAFGEFPRPVEDVRLRVRRVADVHHPALAAFFEQTWSDFVAFVYGTSVYDELIAAEGGLADAWAAALYFVLVESVTGQADEEEVRRLFGIGEPLVQPLKKARRNLKWFVTAFSPDDPYEK